MKLGGGAGIRNWAIARLVKRGSSPGHCSPLAHTVLHRRKPSHTMNMAQLPEMPPAHKQSLGIKMRATWGQGTWCVWFPTLFLTLLVFNEIYLEWMTQWIRSHAMEYIMKLQINSRLSKRSSHLRWEGWATTHNSRDHGAFIHLLCFPHD